MPSCTASADAASAIHASQLTPNHLRGGLPTATPAGACAVAAVGFLLLERRMPAEAGITPGPERVGNKAFRVLWRTPTVILDDPLSPGAKPSPHQASETSRAGEGSHRTS